jgi:hypothetical protein
MSDRICLSFVLQLKLEVEGSIPPNAPRLYEGILLHQTLPEMKRELPLPTGSGFRNHHYGGVNCPASHSGSDW